MVNSRPYGYEDLGAQRVGILPWYRCCSWIFPPWSLRSLQRSASAYQVRGLGSSLSQRNQMEHEALSSLWQRTPHPPLLFGNGYDVVYLYLGSFVDYCAWLLPRHDD